MWWLGPAGRGTTRQIGCMWVGGGLESLEKRFRDRLGRSVSWKILVHIDHWARPEFYRGQIVAIVLAILL